MSANVEEKGISSMKWTDKQPTEPGFYFCESVSPSSGEKYISVQKVVVSRIMGIVFPSLNKNQAVLRWSERIQEPTE